MSYKCAINFVFEKQRFRVVGVGSTVEEARDDAEKQYGELWNRLVYEHAYVCVYREGSNEATAAEEVEEASTVQEEDTPAFDDGGEQVP